ncbi:MAG TPA: HAMP domain-containing sensor histidine kinase [Candidatus Saccharimonadales bacterium]|jgi:hypothetical protein|nr:HAMP domain-containing sensor histidine kinase [Candidatus Saccharimonadales bacterium]
MQGKAGKDLDQIASLFGDQLNDDLAPLVAAAHELKTPLAVIGHLAAMLRDETQQLSTQQQDTYLQRIVLSSERMSRLVDGFTMSYRLKDERQMSLLGLEPVNIVHATESVLHELTPLAQQLDQTLTLRVAARQPLVVANANLLTSVMMNLIDNALKHNPRGSQVDVTLSGRDKMVRSAIHDNGMEISRHDLATLRNRMGSEVQPLSGRAHSSGLGLYIAHQMARAMGGTVGAICHRQQGATFYVDLQGSSQLSFL